MAERAAARRAEVAALVSPEELAALDRRRTLDATFDRFIGTDTIPAENTLPANIRGVEGLCGLLIGSSEDCDNPNELCGRNLPSFMCAPTK
jgi:hypothetical protein